MRLSVCAVAVLTAACLGFGCQRGPDTKADLRQALDQANMQHVDVALDTDEHIVHLQGVVSSMAERSRAEEVADAVVGTSGRVLNELTVKGLNDTTAGDLDDDIQDRLDTMIDGDRTLKQRDINFEVANGMVTIKGDVRTADEKNRVGEMTKAAPGVKDIANGLLIEPGQ